MKLAINGGKPVRENYLAYGKQAIDEQDIATVVEVLKGDYLTTVSNVTKFEQQVAEYVGVNVYSIPVYCRELGYEKGICPIATSKVINFYRKKVNPI